MNWRINLDRVVGIPSRSFKGGISLARRSIGALGNWIIWHRWALLCGAMALLFTFVSGAVRLSESSKPSLDDASLQEGQIGVFGDTETTVAMQYRLLNNYANAPEVEWSIKVSPGESTFMRAVLVLAGAPSMWEINIDKPLTVIMAAPPGAAWYPKGSDLMTDGESCASWYDRSVVRAVSVELVHAHDGSAMFVCRVPAVGRVEQLTFDIRAKFRDASWTGYGIGKVQGGVRVAASLMPDANMQRAGLNVSLRQQSEVVLEIPEGADVGELFPGPDRGSVSTRVWSLGEKYGSTDAADLIYRLEYPRRRTLIQPALDLSLLFAGVFFGLVPAVRRKPT